MEIQNFNVDQMEETDFLLFSGLDAGAWWGFLCIPRMEKRGTGNNPGRVDRGGGRAADVGRAEMYENDDDGDANAARILCAIRGEEE